MKKRSFHYYSTFVALFLLLIFINFKGFSQCAGINNTVTICNKDQNTNYQNFNLFNQLQGTPTTGGTWESQNPANTFALNKNTGIVNLWSINRNGTHVFTYTNPSCGESATVTILLGGYPGENNINGGANACGDNSNVNLFTFLDNNLTNLSADINGTWTEAPSTATGLLDEEIFNALAAGTGTYTFIYTTDPVGTCPSRSATVVLEVHPAAEAGTSSNLIICSTDDLSSYTTVNLFDYLQNEDSNGIWKDSDNTGQITSASDSTINIQEIFNQFGPGDYNFTYTVFPKHGVCNEDIEIVTIRIPDLSASFKAVNNCKTDEILIEILYSPPGSIVYSHNLTYEIRNSKTNVVVYTQTVNDIIVSSLQRTKEIKIPANAIPNGGEFYITATEISNIKGIICNTLTIKDDTFTIYDTQHNVSQQCFDSPNAILNITNLFDASSNLYNGNVTVDYTLKDITNGGSLDLTDQILTFTNGNTSIPIDISSFPPNATDFNVNITKANRNGLECVEFNFKASLIPEDIQLDISVDDTCNAKDIKVNVDAPPLGPANYTITYQVTNSDNSDVLIDNTIVFNGGTANFNVDINSLGEGNYNIVLKSTQNDTNPCRTKFNFEVSEMFSIGGIPSPPVLDENQTFCIANFFPNIPTINDIKVTTGKNLTWYNSLTSTTALSSTTPLVNNTTYFVTATDTSNSCESSARSLVNIKLISTSNILSNNTAPVFCGINNPTLNNFNAIAENGNLLWYDALTGGNLLDANTPIQNGVRYFAVESVNGCEHHTRLEFIATVVNPPKPDFQGNTNLCALEKPTLADLENSITSASPFELLWLDANDNELSNSDLLEENIQYYAVYKDPTTNCLGEKTLISVVLSACNPDNYDFFIPDGFSPNNDGVNDQYFIPYIEYFYPNYEYEIFNRYGQSLFIGNINNSKWNGKSNSGGQATSGVYFYVLRYNKDNLKPKQGRIYLSK